MKKLIKQILNSAGFEIHKRVILDDVARYIELYGSESVTKRHFYNISAGGHLGFGGQFNHPCWTNVDIDLPFAEGAMFVPEHDINHDLLSLKPLPIESATAELVHSQFSIEHITDEAALMCFKEVKRILKKNGVFRIVCPNNVLDYLAYKRQDLGYFCWVDNFSKRGYHKGLKYNIPLNLASLEQVFLVHFASNASTIHSDGADERVDDQTVKRIISEMEFEDAMNYFIAKCSIEKQKKYRQNHVNWWSHEKVFRFLRMAGFDLTYTMGPGQSAASVMRNPNHFDRNWNFVALYIDAIKN